LFVFLVGFSIVIVRPAPARALPEYLQRFARDPFSRPELRTECSTCHVNPLGGGERNPFGVAFAQNGREITPALRAAWPDRFVPSVAAAPVSTQAGQVRATFLANGRDTLLEINGEHFLLNAQTATLERLEQEQVAQLAGTPPAVAPTPAPQAEAAPAIATRPTFDHYLVNMPTALPYRRGRLSLRFTHRFTQPVLRSGDDCPDCAGIEDLYGFDSFSYSSFGLEAGLTQRLAFTFYRSPLNKDYEFGGVLQLLGGRNGSPISAALRLGLQTRRLFSIEEADFERTETGTLVLPVAAAIGDVAELIVAPMFGLNVNPNAGVFPASEGERRRNLAAIGVGTSIRFRPRTAFLAEFLPRVAGYRPDNSRHGLSFGLQHATNGHVFQLTLSNSLGTTTTESFIGGGKDFSLGFNLYRRLR
jgi:hypothetical protein